MIPGSAIPLLLATAGPTFNPRSYFDVKLYTGNGSTQTISGLNFSPDLVWIKNRAAADNHKLLDTVRGATEELESNTTDAEATNADGLTAFTSDGFSLGADDEYNTSSEAFVAWTWDAGSSTVTNTQGSITSQVRANASAGFSVVTYTGTGANATVGHGLGVQPQFLIIKRRDSSGSWIVSHTSIGLGSGRLILNDTVSNTTAGAAVLWNSTAPTSSVFSLGNYIEVNASTATYVAYCFAPVAGYSSFGSYTGNGSATGPVISGLGFQPYFVMIKASSTTGDWWMYDGARSPSNPRINKFKANTPGAEDTAGEDVDFQLDGFQIKTSDSGLNQNAATYIYAAFA
jgi:hypothetical protein